MFLKAFCESHHHPSMFPLVLMYKHVRQPQLDARQSKKGFHFHDWNEIVFIHEGEGLFFINNRFLDFKGGDILTIPGNSIHRGSSSPDAPYIVSVILFSSSLINPSQVGDTFSFMDLFTATEHSPSYLLRLQSEHKQEIEAHLASMQHELVSLQPGHRLSVLNALHHIMLLLLRIRKMESGLTPAKESKNNIWMKEILKYMDEHLHENLSLSLLAKQALISPAHFSRVFSQLTGFSIPEYLNIKRILKAKELLAETDQPVSYIADQCGFNSISHFHKIFKSHVHMTPANFREHRGQSG
ncbi:AraC family transcriptional regulator [Paenibacillus thalictri]|uniref:AraC family transcriptional regulator n=1 Tax=Paenibacillus thalictri TaxID=2527873 RepID=A0A4Q9DLC2_9BACL|nr:AraC family transcriptional regulator [Paenibacillus thalictri]TBL73265.1 AraC family transcriptional regulator [Paenibacillus thalictri]